MTERLLIVANRLPVTLRRTSGRWHAEASSGGLVAALAPVVEASDGRWIGWAGDAGPEPDAERDELLRTIEHQRRMVAVSLPTAVSRAFYEGYSNDTLWPLLHGFPTSVVLDAGSFRAYRDANRRFADVVADRMGPRDLVWVQDYQLMLLPALLRERRPEARIGFFLHVPFPAPETFRILPQRADLLLGMLGADAIGFQTHEHLGAFRRTLLAVLGLESRLDRVEVDERTVHLEARPIGIEPEDWEGMVALDGRVAGRIAELRAGHEGRSLVIAVDRLDYTKGIPHRLRAFRHLLQAHPERRGRVTLIQVAVPSRERVPRYAQLRREVNELVGEINGELATADWSPVVYLRRAVPRRELAALYAAADVAWVGSLRDGMNLVAKEFVACQADAGGVLLLSEFAGAAGEMGEAIRINPYDEPGTAESLERALSMPEDERRERHAALIARVRTNTALAWAQRSVADLRRAADDRPGRGSEVRAPSVPALVREFAAPGRRICYLDYDGTLVPIASRPADAVPGPSLAPLLAELTGAGRTTVAIVSGRTAADLERWFGHLDGVWLGAEHGALLRPPNGSWAPLHPGASGEWKARIRPVLDHFAERAPGSLVEEKELALAWHFRLVEPESGEWLANELATALEQQVAGTDLAVLRGRKVIEVRFAWATKGEVAARIRAAGEPPAFELALGDDRTDEDLFERLGPDAVTIRVGSGATRARYRVPDHAAALGILEALAAGPLPAGDPAAPAPAGSGRTT
jgi:trehalose 6-phosphate synthase/phosphatase